MISDRVARADDGVGELVVGIVAADGSAAHRHARRLAAPDAPVRDLCDAAHLLCAVHGHPPGVVAQALDRHPQPDAQSWLETIARWFSAERRLIVGVSASIGPQPSTPGQAATEATIATSRHAMDTLARSERRGCAIGAVAALVLDWPAMRAVIEHAVTRCGLSVELPPMPGAGMTADALSTLQVSLAVERAVTFGAQQFVHQHRGLWDLLEARAAARDRH